MVTGRELTRDHQLFQIRNAFGTAVMEREISQRYVAGQITDNQFVIAGSGAEFIGHQNAVKATERYMREHRAVEAPHLVDDELVLAEFDLAGAMDRAMSTLGALGRVRELERPQHEIDKIFTHIIGNYATWAARAVQSASRSTIIESSERSGSRWRRVSDGNPCAWCAMLVGRGPVYRTRESALGVVGREIGRGTAYYKMTGKVMYDLEGTITRGKRKGLDRRRGTRDIGEKFHDNCGCTVEESHADMWRPDEREQKYLDLYVDAVDKCEAEGLPLTPENITAAMRELGQGVVHDAVEASAQGAGGSGAGGGPPKAPATGSDGSDDKKRFVSPGSYDPSGGGTSGPGPGVVSVPAGANVSPHEFQTGLVLASHGFDVRFQSLVYQPGRKNPDATVDGEVWEFKSPTGSSEKNTIGEQFKRAAGQSTRLVIDLARCGLPDAIAVEQIKRRFAGQAQFDKVMILDGSGDLIVLDKADR